MLKTPHPPPGGFQGCGANPITATLTWGAVGRAAMQQTSVVCYLICSPGAESWWWSRLEKNPHNPWELLFCSKSHNGRLGGGISRWASLPLSQGAVHSGGCGLLCSQPPLCPNFGRIWTPNSRFLLHLIQPHRGATSRPCQAGRRGKKREKRMIMSPRRGKRRRDQPFPQPQPGDSRERAASAGLSELGMGRARFGQANRDLAG